MVFRFAPHTGGAVIVATEIVNHLAKLGHYVTVLTPDLEISGPKYEPVLDSKVKVVRVETPSRNNLKIAARRCKFNLEKKGNEIGKHEKFDFVLTIFHPFHLVSRAAVNCANKLGIPCIVKIDDAIYEKSTGLKSIQRGIEKLLNSKTLSKASKILVVNENTKELVRSYYKIPSHKIHVVPNGVDLSFFKTIQKNFKKIVFSGVMYFHRGLDELLFAATKVVKKIPDAEFVLLGDGPEIEKLKEIAKKENLKSSVIFKGWVDRDQIPNYLADAAIGIGPLKRTTVTENALPIKVLEYMAAKLTILAKQGTLPSDVLKDGENGYFVSNSEELAQRIIELTESPSKIEKMGKKSYEMVQKFSWKNVVKSILDIYDKL